MALICYDIDMANMQEHLFISREISGLQNPEVLDVLQPTVEDLRRYFEKRQLMIKEGMYPTDDSIQSDHVISDLELILVQDTTPDEAIILRDGEVLVGPRLSLHITDLDGTDPEDTVSEPRLQLARLAQGVKDKGISAEYPLISATTYPKLARLAHVLMGMQYAAATYFPANAFASDEVSEIHDLSNNFQRRNGLKVSDHPEIESLVMPTQEFIDRFARPRN